MVVLCNQLAQPLMDKLELSMLKHSDLMQSLDVLLLGDIDHTQVRSHSLFLGNLFWG